MAPSSALVAVACCTKVTVAAFPGLKDGPLAVRVPVPTLIVAADSASVRGFGLTDGELSADGAEDGRGDGEAAGEGVGVATAGATWSVCCSRHEPFQQSLSRWSPGSMSTGTTKDSSTRPLASARKGKVYRALQSSTRPASGASAPSSASTNAPADSHLASGALASPRRMTASTPGPREESRELGGGGSRWTWAYRISISPSPSNGMTPVSNSYAIVASE